ncbi:uncharacterized protein RSE6_12682 [Rhynchosporium secalis]|uniref:Uncharacterized protein n=1 Tax=Rhynchosporium secalis TaxID=38038 RepID=A0A1E1MR10_RHYSE|nr:uncharacterized protein RSE6_12682 [Rhynchosporium secalis]
MADLPMEENMPQDKDATAVTASKVGDSEVAGSQPSLGRRSSLRVSLAKSNASQSSKPPPLAKSNAPQSSQPPPLGQRNSSRIMQAKSKASELSVEAKKMSDQTQRKIRKPKIADTDNAQAPAQTSVPALAEKAIQKSKPPKEEKPVKTRAHTIREWKVIWAAEKLAKEGQALDSSAAEATTPQPAALELSNPDGSKPSTDNATSLMTTAKEKENQMWMAGLHPQQKAEKDDLERAKWWSPHGGHKHEYYEGTGQS